MLGKSLLVGSLAFVIMACSDDSMTMEDTVSKEEWCTLWYQVAENAMEFRQAGMNLDNVLTPIRESELDPQTKSVFENIYLEAYSRQRYTTPAVKNRVVQEFANEVQMACYEHG